MARLKYWTEALGCALDEAGITLPPHKVEEIAKSLMHSAEMESEASGDLCIPHPALAEAELLKKKSERDVSEADRRAEIFRKALAERCGVEVHRLLIHNGEIEVSRT